MTAAALMGTHSSVFEQSLTIPGSQAWQPGVEAQTKATIDQPRVQSSCLHPAVGRTKDILLVCEGKHLFLFLVGLNCLAQATELLPAECNTKLQTNGTLVPGGGGVTAVLLWLTG